MAIKNTNEGKRITRGCSCRVPANYGSIREKIVDVILFVEGLQSLFCTSWCPVVLAKRW